MIGRDRELNELCALLSANHRLITVIGPPGVGKSLLAARALEGRTGAAEVVLLDDLDGKARVWLAMEAIASERPVLATARSALRIAGEVRFLLGPLSELEAVRLFRERAAETEAADEMIVRTIVGRLDALPLLVELAAEKSAVLSAPELLRRLDPSLALFPSLVVRMEPSWNALTEAEQRALSALAVLPGSFSLDAAESVLGSPAVLETLQALAEASLLHRSDQRLALWAPARALAERKLDRDDRARLEEEHADHYLRFLEERTPRAVCLRDHRAVDRIALEQDHLLAVHERFIRTDPTRAARAALLLDGLFAIRGPFDRHLEILTASLDSGLDDLPGLAGPLLRARGEALRSRRRLDEAQLDLDRALARAEQDDDRGLEILVLQELGMLAREEGRLSEARVLLEQALEAARAEGARSQEGIVLGNLGTLHRYLGEIAAADALYQAALSIHREVANLRSEMIVFGNLGHLAVLAGDLERAREQYRAALSILEELSDPRSEAIIVAHLGAIEAWRGDLQAAEWLLERALGIVRELGDRPMQSVCLAELGAIEASRARVEASRSRFAESKRILAEIQSEGWSATVSVLEGFLDLALSHRDQAQQRLEAMLAFDRDRSTAHTEFLRLAVIRLSEALSETPALVPPSAIALHAARDGSWFRMGDREVVSLERRKPLKRIFAALMVARIEHPNASLSLSAIIGAGWPGENLIPHSATTRAYVAVSTLRRLGLEEVLVRRDGGYLLLGSVPLLFSDP